MKREKCVKQFKCDIGELKKHLEQGLMPAHAISKKKKLNGRSYKELIRSRAKSIKVPDLVLGRKDKLAHGDAETNGSNKGDVKDLVHGRKDKLSQGDAYVTKSNGSNEGDVKVVGNTCFCIKRQSTDFKLKQQIYSCDAELNHGLCGISLHVEGCENASMSSPQEHVLEVGVIKEHVAKKHDEKELEAGLSLELTDDQTQDINCTQSQLNIDIGDEHKECAICMHGGKLLSCNGQGCRRSFHPLCVNPPLTNVQPGDWHCIWCVRKKMELGVHSVSEGIESILDSRDGVIDDEVMQFQTQYLVKYKGLAHVHNRWIPERELLQEAPVLFTRYKRKYRKTRWKTEWSLPHRLLEKRMLPFSKHFASHYHGHDGNGSDCRYEWLVKWTGLNYDCATWELENASFLRSPEVMKLITDYESRHKKTKIKPHSSKEDEGRRNTDFSELSELPFVHSPGAHKYHLSYVNKLRENWHRGQNAVVIDDQERIVKVVLFILSLLGEVRRPFLVITASTALSLWEAEFSSWASSVNIVVYKGNSDVRTFIRTLEFYDKGGYVMFEVLLSPPDVVVEDLNMLESVKWEAIIIDECQRPRISEHLKQIKMLAAYMKLLLVSGQIEDRRFNYYDVLSLLDPEFPGSDEDSSEVDPNIDNCKLKERLAQFLAFECKSGTSNFVEYWVPVHLSNVQIEQYCASLLSNSMLLCSCLKNDSADSLHDILVSTRKCCDHPYLVDRSLQSSVAQALSTVDNLDVGIEASSKLHLLHKILLEIRKRGLRILILFQSLYRSGLISIGDILDDFLHQKFGNDSYARIDGDIPRPKKQAAVDIFNNKESGRFVCLMESRACVPSIKLSSVDTVILFNSDWDPLNDLRALKKITINSQFEQIKIFRLYSSCTVEEKVLILAKEGMTIDSNIYNIRWTTCHMLLTWGAPYLFNKLDDFHGCNDPVSQSNISPEQSLLENVFHELSILLPYHGQNNSHTDCSIILKVQHSEWGYSRNISLLGEVTAESMEYCSVIKWLIDNEPSHAFWTNLLQGRHPRWKYLSRPSKRIRRKVQLFDDLPEGDAVTKNHRKVVSHTFDLISPTPRLKNKRKLHTVGQERREAVTIGAHVTDMPQQSKAAAPTGRVMPTQVASPTVQAHISPSQDSSLPLDELPISTNPSSAYHHQVDMPASREIQNGQGNARNASGQQAQVAMESPKENLTSLSNTSIVQPFGHLPLQPSMLMPLGGSEPDSLNLRNTNIIPNSGNNQSLLASSVTSEVPQFARSVPLQMEMERIEKDKEQAIKMHEDTKLLLKSECEKEIYEIRKKYELLLQNADMALVQKIKDLEAYYEKVHVNKLLAEAFTRKHNSTNAVGSGVQQGTISNFINEIIQLCFQQTPVETIQITEHSSASLPKTSSTLVIPPAQVGSHSSAARQTAARDTPRQEQSLNFPAPIPPPLTPSVQVVTQSSADHQSGARTNNPRFEQFSARMAMTGSFPNPPAQLLSYSSVHLTSPPLRAHPIPTIHCTGNLLSGSVLRAPAPHLTHIRPPPPTTSVSNLLTIPRVSPILQSPINLPLTSSVPTQPTPTQPTCPSGSFINGVGLPVVHGFFSAPEH